MIYEKVLAEGQWIEEQIKELDKQLQNYPKGKLLCARNGTHYKWYQSDGHDKIYIPKSNRDLAKKLAEKKYLSCLMQDLKEEQKAIDFYLRHHNVNTKQAEKLLTDAPAYQELLSEVFKPISQELSDWVNAPYTRNPKYPEQLTQKASNGKFVRSKSEVLIDMALYMNRIPFRYECALDLGETIIYPDFTIRHPKTGEIFYWEHFGKMDSPEYAKGVSFKLQQYISKGIVPGIQLITTYETRKRPLGLQEIDRIIKEGQ